MLGRHQGTNSPAPPSAVRAGPDLFGGVAEHAPRAPQYREPSKFEIRKSSWDRLRLGPNVELSTRTSLPPEQKKLVDRVIEAARQIFGGGTGTMTLIIKTDRKLIRAFEDDVPTYSERAVSPIAIKASFSVAESFSRGRDSFGRAKRTP